MANPRDEKLIDTILDYSVELNESDRLLIRGEQKFKPMLEQIGIAAQERGAQIAFEVTNIQEHKALIERADIAELEATGERLVQIGEWCTASVKLYAHENPTYLADVDSEKISLERMIAKKPFLNILVGDDDTQPGKKFNLFGYPSPAGAHLAGMSYDRFKDFLYSSILDVDWPQAAEQMAAAKAQMDGAEDVHLLVPGMTDFHVSLKGRGAKICAGQLNMPDGEFFYGPVEGSARGYITFPHGTIYNGNYVENVRLTFEDGKVVDITAAKGEEFVRETLSSPGADVPGELGIGCNYKIKAPINNILFDEKIGGTVHLAMGDSYKWPLSSGGGKNVSGEHWDLICDLRQYKGLPGGELRVDDALLQRNGQWL